METIKVLDRNSKQKIPIKAEATNDPNLFIHPTYRPEGQGIEDKWTITHLPSGGLVFWKINSKEDAIKIVDFIMDTVNFAQPKAADYSQAEKDFLQEIRCDVRALGKLDPDRK